MKKVKMLRILQFCNVCYKFLRRLKYETWNSKTYQHWRTLFSLSALFLFSYPKIYLNFSFRLPVTPRDREEPSSQSAAFHSLNSAGTHSAVTQPLLVQHEVFLEGTTLTAQRVWAPTRPVWLPHKVPETFRHIPPDHYTLPLPRSQPHMTDGNHCVWQESTNKDKWLLSLLSLSLPSYSWTNSPLLTKNCRGTRDGHKSLL